VAGEPAALTAATELGRERIEHALERGEAPHAQRLLDEMDDPPGSLKARVDEAMVEHADRQRVAERLAADVDRSVGFRLRRFLIAVFGVAWMVTFGWAGLVMPEDLNPIAVALGSGLTCGALLILLRSQTLLENRLNRLVVSTCLIVVAMAVFWLFAAEALDVPTSTALAVTMLIWAGGTAVGVFNVDARVTPIPLLWLTGFGLSVYRPEWTGILLIVGSAVQTLGFLVVNRLVQRAAER